jgi:hypothetical protein
MGINKLGLKNLTTEGLNKVFLITDNEGRTFFLEKNHFFTLEVFQ